MKFKGLTKLAMSGVALAAVAATLGTSTYAWYVINPTATVTGVEAATESNGATSILVSKDGSNFSGAINFGAADWNGNGTAWQANNRKSDFVPVKPKGATDLSEFYTADEAAKTEPTASTAFMKFNVWVKAGAAGEVAAKLSVVNKTGITSTQTTAVLPTQYAYQQVTSSITATQSFKVDAVNALRTAVYENDVLKKVYETDKIAYTPEYDASSKYTSLGQVTDTTKMSGTTKYIGADGTETESATLYGAHLYYAQVMNKAPITTSDTATVSDATNIDNVTIATANVAVKLTFVIWLEGGDDLCFDACGGQQFDFALRFDAAA
ncbi:MAG: hypothetical protein K6E20_02680 [Acholeplasmatales bacterium]|nr:hypothetical protein [Acholeplasmatales bacterium]